MSGVPIRDADEDTKGERPGSVWKGEMLGGLPEGTSNRPLGLGSIGDMDGRRAAVLRPSDSVFWFGETMPPCCAGVPMRAGLGMDESARFRLSWMIVSCNSPRGTGLLARLSFAPSALAATQALALEPGRPERSVLFALLAHIQSCAACEACTPVCSVLDLPWSIASQQVLIPCHV
eukprot:2726023-Pleurochrysis_carterae.AAC.7